MGEGREEEKEEIACRRVYGGKGGKKGGLRRRRKELQQSLFLSFSFSLTWRGVHAINGLLPLLLPFPPPPPPFRSQMYTNAFRTKEKAEESLFSLIPSSKRGDG